MVQSFNPANVTTTSLVPANVQTTVLERLMGQSAVLQLAKPIDMAGQKEKSFSFMTGVSGAYWNGETQRIATGKPSLLPAKLTAQKLAVIIPVSKEYLKYSEPDFFNAVTPLIVEQFDKAIDLAVIKGVNSPYGQSLADNATKNSLTVTGDINYDNILALEDKLYANNIEGNAFISTLMNQPALRTAVQPNGGQYADHLYNTATGQLDGRPIVNTQSGVLNRGELVYGNFDYLYYGITGDLEVEVSTDGQLSTLTNSDGTPVNLFEQDMVALKATMSIAVLPVRPDAFATINVAQSPDDVLGTVPGDGVDSTDKNAKKNTKKASASASTDASATPSK